MPNRDSTPQHSVSCTGRFGLVDIRLFDPLDSASQPQLEVIAQDRWLVMDPASDLNNTPTSSADLARCAALEPDRTPGEVLLRRGTRPLRLWAVIHDLDRLPTCRRKWIATALLNMMREFTHRQIESVKMPCLGCPQGILDEAQFLDLLVKAICDAPVVHRLSLELSCEDADREALGAALKQLKF